VTKCRYGYDLAHEELARLSEPGRTLTQPEKQYRSVLKETTFFCHYGMVPCGWSAPSETPIYDTLRWEFYFEGKATPQGARKRPHVHVKGQSLEEHIRQQHKRDSEGIFLGYVISERLHDQMHDHRRQQLATLQFEEGIPLA
jgi:hypothetical protein